MTGLPYDGRDRGAPEWTSDISPEEFQDKLVEPSSPPRWST